MDPRPALPTALRMEECFHDRSVALAALGDPEWTVRLAAAVAAGRYRDGRFLDGLAALLAVEDEAPLYTQPHARYLESGDGSELAEYVGPLTLSFPSVPGGPDPVTREAWKRRGRLKQAALFSIAEIGEAGASLRERIRRYALDATEDFPVRMAACRCLGVVGEAEDLPALEAASRVDEWCTATEARKGIEAINARKR